MGILIGVLVKSVMIFLRFFLFFLTFLAAYKLLKIIFKTTDSDSKNDKKI